MSGFAGRFPLDGGPFGISAAETASTAQTLVGFDGRLDNRRELAAACGLRMPGADDGLSDAAVALAAYQHLGDEFAGHLNGDFALAVFDAGRERLLLARDVMSARRQSVTRRHRLHAVRALDRKSSIGEVQDVLAERTTA